MKNKKGFTLIELLAVIVILGLLMAIAIPSVTKYITQSRKKTLINSISSFVTSVINGVNNNEYGSLSNEKIAFYLPVSNNESESCVSLEKGGTDPFGNWVEAYVVVIYDATRYSYDYFFTFYDDAGYGMELTPVDQIKDSPQLIKNPSPVDSKNITTQLQNKAVHTIILSPNGNGSCGIPGAARIIEGDGNTEGDIIAIGKEQFYVIDSTEDKLTLFAKYNINPDLSNPIQNSVAAEMKFSSSQYWNNGGLKPQYGGSYPGFVYDSNSTIFPYVQAYEDYLKILAKSAEATLISHEQLKELGCNYTSTYSCSAAKFTWVRKTNGNGDYWSGSAFQNNGIWAVYGGNDLYHYSSFTSGIRPVVTISKSEIDY